MHLLVFYTVHLFDELDEEHFYEDRYILVNVPDNLLKYQFKDYVLQNYCYDIFKIEKDCSGSYLLSYNDITINNVFHVSELNKREDLSYNDNIEKEFVNAKS